MMRKTDPDFKKRENAASLRYHRRHLEFYREYDGKHGWKNHLRKSYGLTMDEFNRMVLDQDGKCYICGKDNGKYKLRVDHNHTTGRLRKLLCNKCNQMLGMADEIPAILEKGANYLRQFGQAIGQ
jgi:uncharacterized protein YbaR (Trm112 family)